MTAGRRSSVAFASCLQALTRGEDSIEAEAAIHVLAETVLKIRSFLTPKG